MTATSSSNVKRNAIASLNSSYNAITGKNANIVQEEVVSLSNMNTARVEPEPGSAVAEFKPKEGVALPSVS